MSMTIGQPPTAEPPIPPAGEGREVVVTVVADPRPHGIGVVRTVALFVLPFAGFLYIWLAARAVTAVVEPPRPEASPVVREAPPPDGAHLYTLHCARCHGGRGNADGYASPYLDPPARRFGAEKFQLASTPNGVPTDDDLVYVIHRGIPGTAMPAFDFLSEAEQRAIAGQVRRLTYAGLYAKLWKDAERDEDPIPEEIRAMTIARLTPEPVLNVPSDLPAFDAESIARGKKFFTAGCVSCHGPEGKGDGKDVKGMKNDDPSKGGNGRPTQPRDLARGIYKGGGEPERLYRRIALGMPGTPMPSSSTLKPSEIGDLVNFVRSLSQPPATGVASR